MNDNQPAPDPDIDHRTAADCAKARKELGTLADAFARYPAMLHNLERQGFTDSQLIQAAADADVARGVARA